MMLCVLYRWKISNTFDNGREVSPGCRRHLMQCGRCRSFFTSSLAMGERLSLEAALAQPAVPGPLGHRVAAMIGHGARTGRHRHALPRPGLAAACAAIALMPVLLLAAFYLRADRVRIAEVTSAAPPAMFSMDAVNVAYVAESFANLERPLPAEIESLQRQAISALQFLIACSGADLTIQQGAM